MIGWARRWLARRCDRLAPRTFSLRDAAGEELDKDAIGRLGEEIACRWLWLEGGCKILYRNFRAGEGGEVDIVCRHVDTLVFVEVKTRTSEAFGRPALAVGKEKQALIVRGAREWMRLLGWPPILFRFDIVEVLLSDGASAEVRWLQAAFELPTWERW